MRNALHILFIGNSHTYCNDMPLLVKRRAENAGYDCSVAMLAHPGWYLAQHAQWPEARFNILHGGYDYVVLQEHAHPFGPVETYHEGAAALNGLIRKAGSVPVLYAVWSEKAKPEMQAVMNAAHEQVAKEIGALLAPVGENWQQYQENHPDLELYADDGEHASPAGSDFAASVIWETIYADQQPSCALRKEENNL